MGELRIEKLTKQYGKGQNKDIAVQGLDITVNDGEFLVLVGPSGCGKSTTLRCIAGLEEVTKGDVKIDGESIIKNHPSNRDTAMVFQNYALYPHMTVEENMSFGLKMSTDLTREEIKSKVEEAAKLMEIDNYLHNKPTELSGGQQQRVALGRAIVRDPSVFLLDEPLSNLDAKLRSTMRIELQKTQAKLETTTIYVTHDQTEAMTMGDRIAILNDGELQQIGTPMECYDSPKNQFVAGFIGSPSMNFIDVTYRDGSLEHELFSYPLSKNIASKLKDTGELVLGIRPSDIRLSDKNAEKNITTTVQVLENIGEKINLNLSFGDQQITGTFDSSISINRGENLYIKFPQESIHLFDKKTGDAITNKKGVTEKLTHQ